MPHPSPVLRRLVARTFVAALLVPLSAGAQAIDREGLAPLATRAQLTALVHRLDSVAAAVPTGSTRRADAVAGAARVRERLRAGDFRPGDQVIIEMGGTSPTHDTLSVRTGAVLVLRDMPAIPLSGVLRAELEPHVLQFVGRFLKNPQIRATSLTRLVVSGEVTNPGFYSVSSDLPLSEVIMRAGGPSATADLRKVTLRRGSTELLGADATQEAIRRGRTLDQLDLRPGDELSIRARRQGLMQGMLPVLALVTSVGTLLVAMRR